MMQAEWLETPGVRELVPILSRLEQGQEAMTRQLLLRVVDTLAPWTFGSGVNLFAYNDDNKTDEENARETSAEESRQMRIGEDWSESWVNCSRPEWMYVFMAILIEPPRSKDLNEPLCSVLDDDLCFFFLNVAKRFPNEAVQMIALLFNDEKTRPAAEEFLRGFAKAVMWEY